MALMAKQIQTHLHLHVHSTIPSPNPLRLRLSKGAKTRPPLTVSALDRERSSPTEVKKESEERSSPTEVKKESEERSSPTEVKKEVEERSSPTEVKKEIERCYELVRQLGRGIVYLGSSRFPSSHPHYRLALELSREAAKLLDCTTWTGAGPGLMDAAIQGAMEAKKPVGGFKIAKEAGEWTSSNFHSYLLSHTYLTCRFFSARKHGLVDAAVRNNPSERTAVIAFPGGIGTLDEIFEILTLIQLKRIGSKLPVPFLLMNYDGYYDKLLEFLEVCESWNTVGEGEVEGIWKVCGSNFEALEYLTEFYGVSRSERNYDIGGC
ncbi:hypothetical protein LUZ60_004954 [Juncus effusus]|nr:hypothetical protein LUZ60_004954 [Juncus effusus]